jgi:hypothetical protein
MNGNFFTALVIPFIAKQKPATASFTMTGNIGLYVILNQLLGVIQLCT